MKETQTLLALLEAHSDQAAALATLVAVEGSSYRKPGARLLLLADGTHAGGISGGCLEDDLLERARRTLATGEPQTLRYDTTEENDLVWGVGTGCSGVAHVVVERLPARERPSWLGALRENFRDGRGTGITVVYGESVAPPVFGTHLTALLPQLPAGARVWNETVEPPTSLVIFGAGDNSRPLVRMAAELGWRITVADTRPAYATAERFPEAARIVTAPAAELVARVAPDARTHAVVMTHRYRDDVSLLRPLLESVACYVGLLGARQRTERLLAEVCAAGFALTPSMRARLHAPVGLDLGLSTPEGVALSILAEIQARLGGRQPLHLRDRKGPIHG